MDGDIGPMICTYVRRSCWDSLFLFVAIAALGSSILVAQLPGPNPLDQPDPVVLHHLFFRHVASLSQKADELDRLNRLNSNGNSLRRAFSSKIGLSSEDTAALFSIAIPLDAQIAALDQQHSLLLPTLKKS